MYGTLTGMHMEMSPCTNGESDMAIFLLESRDGNKAVVEVENVDFDVCGANYVWELLQDFAWSTLKWSIESKLKTAESIQWYQGVLREDKVSCSVKFSKGLSWA
jgi:hypothetical protein